MTAAYPLAWPEGWPRTKDVLRKNSSPFQTTFDRARRDLRDQLRMMGARPDAIISSWIPLRSDGNIYADAARRKIPDPGVAVYFIRGTKQLVLARDLYWNVHDNLRSIGLALEHMRGLERHGGAPMLERAFEGFAALSAPAGARGPSCWEILDVVPGAAREAIRDAFWEKAKHCHPDEGGSPDEYIRLCKARKECDEASAGGQT